MIKLKLITPNYIVIINKIGNYIVDYIYTYTHSCTYIASQENNYKDSFS